MALNTVGAYFDAKLGKGWLINGRARSWKRDLTGMDLGFAYCQEVIDATAEYLESMRIETTSDPRSVRRREDWEARVIQVCEERVTRALLGY
jgi:hypothetical protein